MSQAEVLKELARQVRGGTLQVFDATEPEVLTWAPPGTSNHILWHAGHAVWLQDFMCVEPLSGQSELPDRWATMFGGNSQPRTIDRWPSREDIREQLQSQLARILQLLDETPDDRLSLPPAKLRGQRTTLAWIIHGLHDEAKHNGEMYLLWKLYRHRQ